MRDSRSSLAVDGDHVGGEGEEVVAGLADDGGVPRALGGEGGNSTETIWASVLDRKMAQIFALRFPKRIKWATNEYLTLVIILGSQANFPAEIQPVELCPLSMRRPPALTSHTSYVTTPDSRISSPVTAQEKRPTEAAAEDAAARADGSEKRDGKMGGPANRGFSVF